MLESGSCSVRVTFFGEDHVAVLAGQADRLAALGVDRHHDLFVDRAGKHHLDHFDGALVGDAEPGAEFRLDAELVEHLADLRAAAVDDHRLDAGSFQQRDVAGKGLGKLRVAHGVAAVLHHHDLLVVGEHVGQRRRDQPCRADGVGRFLVGGVRSRRGLVPEGASEAPLYSRFRRGPTNRRRGASAERRDLRPQRVDAEPGRRRGGDHIGVRRRPLGDRVGRGGDRRVEFCVGFSLSALVSTT